MLLSKYPWYFSLSLLILLVCNTAAARQKFNVAQVPDPMQHGSYVSNPDNLIAPATEQELNRLLDSLDRSGRAQVAVVLLKTIGDQVPKDVAHELFRTWKPGNAEKDNGLVVLLVDDQHCIEFETGYGLEGDLPDVVCFRIQQKMMLPYFKQNDYDAGVLQGLQAVVSVLRQGDVAVVEEENTAESLYASPESQRELPGGFTLVIVFGNFIAGNIIFWTLYARMRPRKPHADTAATAPLYRAGWIAWFCLFILPIALLSYLLIFTSWSFGSFTVAAVTYLSWVLFLCAYVGLTHRNAARRLADSDRYQRYVAWATAQQSLFMMVLFPVPLFFFSRWLRKMMYELRSTPYECDSCNNTMKRLGEKADDKFLEKYQVVEEDVGAVDYDVWHCKDCETVKVFGYDIRSSSVSRCPQCDHKTRVPERQEVVQAASSSSSGWGWQHYKCHFCNFTDKEEYVIPATGSSTGSSSSFSSSSGSSSSSGGSWGGGSSGGGGAGSSW